MNPIEFEELIKDLDRNKYHICRMMQFGENGPYIADWEIFLKDMPEADFFSEDNTAILSSKRGDNFEDLKEFVEKEKNI